MRAEKFKKPDFLIIGAQKCGTTWLWHMIDQHPETDLPDTKEIHYFGGSENFNKGRNWYYKHFAGLEKNTLTGEASTSYLYDHVPFWYNRSNKIEIDKSLPSIPQLIKNELQEVKLIVLLRNPISRAISAYKHLMRRVAKNRRHFDKGITPALRLEDVATLYPKKRILEYGYYSKYLRLWYDTFPRDSFKIFIFEEDLLQNAERMVFETYQFLGINPRFRPTFPSIAVNKSWGWTRTVALHYLPERLKGLAMNRGGRFLDRYDILKKTSVTRRDIAFLKDVYAEEKRCLEDLLERNLPWNI